MVPNTRILIVATNKWFSVGQFLAALIQVGFDVAVVCPSGNPIKHIKRLSARYTYSSFRSQKSIRAAIADWKPQLLVCNDDRAVRELHNIHRQARAEAGRPESGALAELIEFSLGASQGFATSRSKSRIISVAQALQIACPPTIVFNSYRDIDRHLGRITFPALLKLDESWGGRGVRLVYDDRDLMRAALELSFPHEWPKSVKSLLARVIDVVPIAYRPPLPQNTSLQHYVCGKPANRAVLCWKGKILAGITIEAIETSSEFGPTTLAHIFEHAEITEATEKIVQSQRLSGFLGFDFMIDHANQAWFVEMNPRVTPACHLRFKAPSLPAALFLQLTGELPHGDTREVPGDRIALFPNRVSNATGSRTYFDDTPEDEPAFLEACRR